MGKKSTSIPGPDPRLVEAQMRSMGIQDQAIQQVMDLAQKQYEANAEFLPMQKEALQFGLDAQRQAYDDSRSDRDFFLGRRGALSGVQDQMIADASKFSSESEQNSRAQAAQAQIAQQFQNAREGNDRAMASMGVSPASGRYADMMTRVGIDQARLGVAAANDARRSARDEGRMLQDRANNALAGYPAQGMAATGAGAGYGAGGVGVANAGVGGINAGYGATAGTYGVGGGMAGQMGNNATNMWNAQANYKLQADQLGGADLSGIGAIAGGAAKLWQSGLPQAIFAGSARAYKQDVDRVGTHPALGIGVYRFRYTPALRARWGAGWKIGVMADELAAVLPGAVGVDADGFTVVDYGQVWGAA